MICVENTEHYDNYKAVISFIQIVATGYIVTIISNRLLMLRNNNTLILV